jgi:hypothetical protein
MQSRVAIDRASSEDDDAMPEMRAHRQIEIYFQEPVFSLPNEGPAIY